MHSLYLTLLIGATLTPGDGAPDFSVYDTSGLHLQLSKLVRKGPVILAFFPKAFTSG